MGKIDSLYREQAISSSFRKGKKSKSKGDRAKQTNPRAHEHALLSSRDGGGSVRGGLSEGEAISDASQWASSKQ